MNTNEILTAIRLATQKIQNLIVQTNNPELEEIKNLLDSAYYNI